MYMYMYIFQDVSKYGQRSWRFLTRIFQQRVRSFYEFGRPVLQPDVKISIWALDISLDLLVG